MSDIPVFYVAHCVSAPTREGILANLIDTKAWFKFLVETIPGVAFSAPWLPYVETLDETIHRERGLRDDHVMIDRHDGIVLTGPKLSSGMKGELDRLLARKFDSTAPYQRGVINLVGIGTNIIGLESPSPSPNMGMTREKLEEYVRGEFKRVL